MANKKISELTPSTQNFRDTDWIEGQRSDGVGSIRYTGLQLRAIEKQTREEYGQKNQEKN